MGGVAAAARSLIKVIRRRTSGAVIIVLGLDTQSVCEVRIDSCACAGGVRAPQRL
jgi:hypothetical protein